MSTEPDLAQRLLEDVIMGSRAPHTQVVKVSHEAPPPAPTPPWHIWLCAGLLMLSAVISVATYAHVNRVAAAADAAINDAKAEGRANNANRENDIRELRQADKSLQAYINAGLAKTAKVANNSPQQ